MKNKTIGAVVVTAIITFLVTSIVFVAVLDKYGMVVMPAGNKKFSKANAIMTKLKSTYVDKISESKLKDGMYRGMVDSLKDPYTVYMSKKEIKGFFENVQGSYAGIGVTMSANAKVGRLEVVVPFEGSPAYKAGIKPGDYIISVNGVNIGVKDMDKAISMMKGTAGKKIKLVIYRPSLKKNLEKSLVTEEVVIPTVSHKIVDKNIGYIQITQFTENVAQKFHEALVDLKNKGIKGLIIDVRDNPGGYYEEVVSICDELLPKDEIVYTIDKKGNKDVRSSDDKHQLKMPIAVLVNGQSASASEILSGALKDNKRGVLIGTKTFGKGLVQNTFLLPDGSGLKITIARYYTPSGVCIQGKGIKPNIEVKLPKNKVSTLELTKGDKDTQMDKALEYMEKAIVK